MQLKYFLSLKTKKIIPNKFSSGKQYKKNEFYIKFWEWFFISMRIIINNNQTEVQQG